MGGQICSIQSQPYHRQRWCGCCFLVLCLARWYRVHVGGLLIMTSQIKYVLGIKTPPPHHLLYSWDSISMRPISGLS